MTTSPWLWPFPEPEPIPLRRRRGHASSVRGGPSLVLIYVNDPADGNRLGTWATELWKRAIDLIRDLSALFAECGLEASDEEIWCWGSVHLHVAVRRRDA